jgi:predicted peptidase
MRTFLTAFSIAICLMGCNKESSVISSTNTGNPSTETDYSNSRPKPFFETEPPVLIAVTKSINSDVGGYYIALPAHYQTSSEKYPLLIYMHGAGVYGNGGSDLPKVLTEAIPKLLNNKLFPPGFLVNGKHYSFIVMTPQFVKNPDNIDDVISTISYAKANYRIDSTRIYLTGISSGSVAGGYTCAAYPSLFAAVAPVAGITSSQQGCQNMVDAKLPIWAFHNDGDQRISVNTTKDFVSMYNSLDPAIPAKLTIFSPYGNLNHDAWTKAMDPAYKEDGKNMYEWMLQYSR